MLKVFFYDATRFLYTSIRLMPGTMVLCFFWFNVKETRNIFFCIFGVKCVEKEIYKRFKENLLLQIEIQTYTQKKATIVSNSGEQSYRNNIYLWLQLFYTDGENMPNRLPYSSVFLYPRIILVSGFLFLKVNFPIIFNGFTIEYD